MADAARETGAAIPGLPAVNTIKICREGLVESTPDRSLLYEVQTPQAARADWLSQALISARKDGFQERTTLPSWSMPVFPSPWCRGSEPISS